MAREQAGRARPDPRRAPRSRAVARAAAFLAALLCTGALAQESGRAAAILLIAAPELADPNFEKTVVLVARHAGVAGPVGVIVNRRTSIPIARAFPDAKGLAGLDDKLYSGGPVARNLFFYVLKSPEPPADAIEVAPGVYLGSNPRRLKALLERDKPMEDLRIYAGHAAWAPGQLEAEVARGFWKSARVDASAVFAGKPEVLWDELIRRAAATPVMLRVQ